MFFFGFIYSELCERCQGDFNIKRNFKTNITQKELQEELQYHPETGEFFWIKPKVGRPKDRPAGSEMANGYRQIRLNGTQYLAHRLAYLYVIGEWPPEYLDHIDGNIRNNRWENLRPATAQENSRNKRRKYNSYTGIKGVTFNPVNDTWEVQLKVGEVYKRFGPFFSYQKACKVYDEEASKAFGEFYRKEPIRKQKANFNDDDVTNAVEDFLKEKECQNSV